MSYLRETGQSQRTTIAGQRLAWTIVITFSVVCLSTTTHAISQGRYSTYYRRRNNHPPGITTSTTITWPENPLPPTWDDSVAEPLASTTSPAPADTLNSPLLDAYLPVTPSISPSSSQSSHGKAFVRPHRRRVIQRTHQLLPRRNHNSRDPWRVTSPGSLQRWPLQVLEDDSTTEVEDDAILHWWVTNEPQLTLVAPETPETTIHQPNRFRPSSGTKRVSISGDEYPSYNHLGIPQIDRLTPRPPRTRPSSASASSSPTLQPPFPPPTTLAEDPAVLQAPHDLIRNIADRQPRCK